jgi:ABC-type phosphate transport system substrate-binding protein
MRKLSFLFLFAAFGLASTTTFAQEVKEEVKAVVEKVQKQEKVEIKLSELPEAVTKALGEEFAEYTAGKAYKVTKDGTASFYVKLEKDGTVTKVHFNAEGKVLGQKEIEKPKS